MKDNKNDDKIKIQKLEINNSSKPTNSHIKIKKINVELPVKYKSIDFFKINDIVRSGLKSSENELGRNNIQNCREYLEHCLYYYNNILSN